jgi:[ribosomal protein S18]-alanine N-acetyltransferase
VRLDEHVHSAIRKRRDQDVQECAALLAEVHAKDQYPVHWPDDPSGWLTPPGMAEAWVAEAGNEVIGHVCLVRRGTPTQGLMLERLFVSTSQRGRGLGSALLIAAGTWAAQHEYRLTLDVLENCTDAIRLYRALGWRLIDQTPIDWADDVKHALLHFEAP